METKRKCNVVMLATSNKAYTQLILRENRLMFQDKKSYKNDRKGAFTEHYHLYITSDEEIKEGDKVYDEVSIYTWTKTDVEEYKGRQPKGIYKIIATTDTLRIGSEQGPIVTDGGIIDGNEYLPSPSPQFIQKYVEEYNKGNIITDVMVEYESDEDDYKLYHSEIDYKGYSEVEIRNYLKVDSHNHITITKIKDSWSREEVISLIKEFRNGLLSVNDKEINYTNKWIENNL